MDDFDFESMNARFDKVKLAEEVKSGKEEPAGENGVEAKVKEEALTLPANVEPYNKTKSFFDSISCDALDRLSEQEDKNKPRKSFQEQRRLDEETFGRGSGGRGGRGRGGNAGRRYQPQYPREGGASRGGDYGSGGRGGAQQRNYR